MDWTRVPVVVGGGQLTNREEDPALAPDPFVLMESAARLAAADIGASGPDSVLAGLTHLFMVHSLSLRHGDPAAELARRLGAGQAEAALLGHGRVDPPVARQPGRRARRRGRATPRADRRGRSLGHPPARQEAGGGAPLAVLGRVARDVAAARARPRRAPRRAGPRAGAGHHHVRAGGVGRRPRGRSRPRHEQRGGRRAHGPLQRRRRLQPDVVVPHPARTRRRS